MKRKPTNWHFGKIPHIVKKNFTLIFRNWTSFLLLILGPFVLMFLIGLAFSSYAWSGMTVGVVHSNSDVVSQFIEPLGDAFGTAAYTDKDECVLDLLREDTNICIVLSDSFSMLAQKEFAVDNLPSGEVTFIYDNSKTLVSQTAIGFMREQFGLTSDQITIEGITQLLSDLTQVRGFLESSNSEITSYVQTLKQMHNGVVEFETTLTQASKDFDEVYAELLIAQTDLNKTNTDVQTQIRDLDVTLSESDEQLQDIESTLLESKDSYDESQQTIKTNLDALQNFRDVYENSLSPQAKAALGFVDIDGALEAVESNEYNQLGDQMDDTLLTISDVRDKITEYEQMSDQASTELPQRVAQFNNLVVQAKGMKDMLGTASEFVSTLRTFTQTSLDSFTTLSTTLDGINEGFKDLDNVDASSIVTPVSIEPEPLVESTSLVYLLFPLIIPIIVVFLSLLFSNIIMLNEIYSKAQMRNFILPIHDIYIVLSFFITNWLIIMFQITGLFIVAQLFLGISLLAMLPTVFLISILLSSIFILIGMIFAYISSSKENSVLLSTFVTVSILFVSDAFIPAEVMNPLVGFFVKLNPLVIAESAYRVVLFHDVPFLFYLPKLAMLFGVVLLLFGVLLAIVHKHRHWYHERA